MELKFGDLDYLFMRVLLSEDTGHTGLSLDYRIRELML